MSSNSTIAALEQKYIELLQKKIASLETPIISSELTSGSRLEKKVSNSSMTAVNGDAGEVVSNSAQEASAQAQAAETVSRKESTVRSPIRFRQRKYNTQGFTEETEVSSAAITKPEANAKKTDHAMTFLQCFDESQKYSYSVITIEDDDLKALLFYALSHHPFFSHWENMAIASLFEPFIHNWSRLNAFVDKDTSHSSVAGFYTELESVSSTENRLAPLKDLGALNKALGNLKELLQLVQDTPGLKTYFSGERRMNEDAEAVSFHYLWTIFPPGEIVISRPYMGRLQAFIVKESTDYIRSHRRNDDKFWDLECWSYDWNGTEFNRIPVKFSFEDYKGFRSISSLSCYPMRYHRGVSDEGDDIGKVETPEALRELLIKRGKRYRKLCLHKEGNQLFEYDGFALSTGAGVGEQPKTTANQDEYIYSRSLSGWTTMPEQRNKAPAKRNMIKSDRVMVDFASYISHGPQRGGYSSMGELEFVEDDACRCSECRGNEKLKGNQKVHYDSVKPEQKWEETQYLICPPRVLGYHFQSKCWVELDVNKVRDIEKLKDDSAFKSLELPKTQKELIGRLVSCHGVKNEDRSMRDLMKGKGNGLVILLHGPPGVGKTLTAESVAKATGKPLFSVSVSDIGLEPSEVERKLEILFELAAIWRAVMLFDEADVFLESRSSNTSNLERNALVSILLRILEYYEGILILTTNRIKTFDIAVQSRINLAVRYNNLDDKQKKRVYLNFIDQLNEENTENIAQLKAFVENDEEESPFKLLNGRQIRNVLFSAASLAKGDDAKQFRLSHIEQVLKETVKFQTDIQVMIDTARQEAEVGYSRR